MTTIRARFDGKEFIVSERSQDLPATADPLLHYLNTLALSGWKATRGKFDSWEVTLTMEQQKEVPYKTGAAYMIPVLHQMPCPGGRSTIADQHNLLMESLQKSAKKDGWEVLAGPKQFSIGSELWTISIWVKSYPRT
jgi:hypothetical protein